MQSYALRAIAPPASNALRASFVVPKTMHDSEAFISEASISEASISEAFISEAPISEAFIGEAK